MLNSLKNDLPRHLRAGCKRFFSKTAASLDGFITEERVRIYPIMILVGSVLALTISDVVRILDPSIQGALEPDFLAHWTGGRILLTGEVGALYDPATQFALQEAAAKTPSGLSWFVSPPVVAAFYAPFAFLPYNMAGIIWLILSTGLLVACSVSLRFLAPGLMQRRRAVVICAIFASPPVFELLGGGQDSAFMLAIWLVGIRLYKAEHSLLAGAVWGLGSVKPQLVILVPLILLVARNGRSLLAFTLVSGCMVAASVWLAGVNGLQQWLAALSSPTFMDQIQSGQSWKMLGLPSLALAFVPPGRDVLETSVVMWAGLPLGAAVLLFQLYKVRHRLTSMQAIMIATLATVIVFSPHVLTYDGILFIPIVLFLLEHRPTRRLRVAAVLAFILLWLTPVLHLAASQLAWPLSMADAPWAALPLAVIWMESLRALESVGCRQQPMTLETPQA